MTALARWQGVRNWVFGDRRGWAVFLSSAVFLGVTWRLGFFINDNITIANTLVNVADGHLALTQFPYHGSVASPGLHVVDGRLYGRNYGEVALALPALGVITLLAKLASLRVALTALWCLGVLALSHEAGVLLEERGFFDRLGAVAAVGFFAVNLPLATTVDSQLLALTALQLATLLEAAFAAVVLYRLVEAIETPSTGVIAGLALVVATPLGFWAVIPKRHALVAAGTLLGLFCLYHSRAAADPTRRLRFRVAAYAAGALLAWVQPLEALAYCIALAAVDIPTNPPRDARALAALAGGFLVALLPFLATNTIVAGNPLTPPRLTPNFRENPTAFLENATQSPAAPSGSNGGASTTASTVASSAAESPRTLYARLAYFASFVDRGLHTLFDPNRLYHTFVRSGWLGRISARDSNQAVTLSVLESMPLTGALLALPFYAHRRLPVAWRDPSAARTTDAVAAVYLVVFTLAYLPRLPLHAMVNLRYLVPAFAVATYAVVRVPGVVRALSHVRLVAWTYAGCVLVGGQLLVAVVVGTRMWDAEAVQFHAVLALGSVGLVLVWLGVERFDEPRPRVGAVVLSIAAAVTTLFLLLGAWLYFPSGGAFVLPAVRWLAARLALS